MHPQHTALVKAPALAAAARDSARAVRNNQSQVLYYEGALEDITERKWAEKALHRLNEIFDRAVAEDMLAGLEADALLHIHIAKSTGFSRLAQLIEFAKACQTVEGEIAAGVQSFLRP